MLKCGWGEKCSPDLPAPVSVDTWVLTGHEGENKNAAQSWVQVCLGVPASAQAVQAGCTVGGVDVSVCVCWPKCRGNGGQSQAGWDLFHWFEPCTSIVVLALPESPG